MISARPLALEVSTYQALRVRLLTEWPEIDEETLADSLEGIADLHAMIAVVIRSALVDEALHSGLRLRLDDMNDRLSLLELRATKKRHLALEAMTAEASPSSSSQTLPPQPAPAPLPSSLSPRRPFLRPIGCSSDPGSTG